MVSTLPSKNTKRRLRKLRRINTISRS
ncbi:UNVERIFIED_CONTAM: hypothetical protein GTU68_033568 [Idotea baltica]|nr:hypothetical protein [Idotea baltica]